MLKTFLRVLSLVSIIFATSILQEQIHLRIFGLYIKSPISLVKIC